MERSQALAARASAMGEEAFFLGFVRPERAPALMAVRRDRVRLCARSAPSAFGGLRAVGLGAASPFGRALRPAETAPKVGNSPFVTRSRHF